VDDETSADRALSVEVEHEGPAITLSVKGDLDAATAPELANLCLAAFDEGARELVIDLTDTSFLDSSGLRALIGARQLFADEGALRLSHASEPVLRLLDLTGLTDFFALDDHRNG
jgi:anti-sigma B factor antagonist